MFARVIRAALIVLAFVVTATGLVAFLDPFQTGQPWLNWAVLVGFGAVSCATVTFVAIMWAQDPDPDDSIWLTEGYVIFWCGLLSALFLGFFGPGAHSIYQSLVWSGYLAGLLSAIVTWFAAYLASPSLFDFAVDEVVEMKPEKDSQLQQH